MTFSNFVICGYYDPASPAAVSGNIFGFLYWYEGLENWVQLTDTPPTVPYETAFHLAVGWLNQSEEAICGHVELTVTRPDGTKITPLAVENQNRWAAPGNGLWVQFEPITLDQGGIYTARATLSAMGEALGEKTFDAAKVYEARVDFRRERKCMEGHMENGQWVCTRYSSMERTGYITVTNQGPPGQLEVQVQGYLHWAQDYNGEKACQLHSELTSRIWSDDFLTGQERIYTFDYMVPITGMPLDTRFFIKVYDPHGNIIAEEVFTMPL